ncbi:MAG TPA: hypothetical protein VFR37_24855 [Longimicrobium sp.]|nr:hypothetical protein [Longimicrobium sp.]
MRKLITAVALACITATPALAQQAPQPGYKDPGTAMLVGVLVPGGGHMYAGETQKGLMLLGVGLGGLVLGTAMTSSSAGISCDEDVISCEDDTNYLPMAVGYLAWLGSWIYGIVDADDSAHRMNAQRGLARLMSGDVVPMVASSGDGTRVGVSVRF